MAVETSVVAEPLPSICPLEPTPTFDSTIPPVSPRIPRPDSRLSSKSDSQRVSRRPEHARRIAAGVNVPIAAWLILVHVGALAAPWTFTWQGLAAMVVLHWVTGGIGICLGYHRLFTHRSFQTYRPIRWFIALIGGLAGEGGVIDWVANHRKHHALSDQDGDPHSPRDGSWWSHVFWIACDMDPQEYRSHVQRWSPDLVKSPMLRLLGQLFLPSHFVLAALLFSCGHWLGGPAMGFSLLVWGLFVRLALVMHCTWLVNSASHLWGYRNYETNDDSRNSWWVALVTYGEGWHNNHHAYPRMANHGHRWWEYDVTFRTIRLMERFGLAWDVVDYKHKPRRKAAELQHAAGPRRNEMESAKTIPAARFEGTTNSAV